MPYNRHSSANSITSTRRSPDSIFDTKLCGRRNLRAASDRLQHAADEFLSLAAIERPGITSPAGRSLLDENERLVTLVRNAAVAGRAYAQNPATNEDGLVNALQAITAASSRAAGR